MPNIFNYINYRRYLEDFYLEQKRRSKVVSYQYLANKAGFRSKSFIKLVIDGKKNLTPESITKINKVLCLTDKSFSYFCDIVAFDQAKALQERTLYFEKIATYNHRSTAQTVRTRHYEIYSKWYTNALREIVTTVDFKDDFEVLGNLLKPSISARMAREAVTLLVDLGFLEKQGSRYVQCDKLITTGDEVRSLAISNFHLQNLSLAANAIETVSSAGRDISCLVLGLSNEGFDQIKAEIQNFRKKLLAIAAAEKQIDRVYHVNFQAVPVSEVLNDKQ